MLRKLSCLAVALGLTLPVWAAERPGSISGYVHSASGVPQMGAMVEVLGSAAHRLRVFTDQNGFYSVKDLVPGTYKIKVTSPAFMPALRDRVGLRSGGSVMVNLTLNTLFDAINLAPLRGPADDDDWKWVLRSVSNRPILRVLERDGKVAKAEGEDDDFKGTLSFFAGSAAEGFGGAADMSTGFSVEKSVFSSGLVALRGNVGYSNGSPGLVLRTSYSHQAPNGAGPEIALTMRRLAAPEWNLHTGSLQALSLTASDNIVLGDILELRFGSELQTIQFMGRVTALRPFGTADLHLSPNTILEYRYSSTQPDRRLEKGFESAPADLSESGPHVSLANFNASLERAHHHEVSLSRRLGKNTVQLAAYYDRVTDPALTGVGELAGNDGDVLPDIYSGTFTYQGRELNTQGMRVVMQRKLNSDLTATLDYEYGGVLDLDKPGVSLADARDWMEVRKTHSVAGKLSGILPASKTRWIASYRWTGGRPLTPVDMFDASPGQIEPYLNLFLRQPIPGTGFLPGHMDALIDVRNLLAQGYVPVMGQDGKTVYLVQSARAVRGGVAFTF
jgi:hypothetical protein